MKNERTRYSCSPPRYTRWLRISVSIAMILLLMNIGSAQNFIVNGTVNNTGKIRVKNQTTIAQANVGGEIELTGANQILPAKQYQSVRLSGTGTKTTSGGNLSVQKNLTIAAAITLQIPKSDVITLGDTLFESGVLKGAIQKSVNLTGSTTSSNFGNIGATISWSSTAPGITSVLRASDSVQIGNGNESVKRYYQIQPTDATATGTVTFKFAESELNGHDINSLQLWRSGDNGTTWQRHIPVVDTLLKTISKANVALSGRWAIADTVRALGPLNSAAGIPSSMVDASAPNVQPSILTALNTFKVLITDIFGTPLKNVQVHFAISSKPASAVGQQLSDTLVVTDSLGYAYSILTLGNKVGAYVVTATSSSLTPIVISTTAKHGAAASLATTSSTVQSKTILSPLDSLFTITVADIGGNLVGGAQVQFAIVNLPTGSFGQSLSATNVLTDSLGKASTRLTLGSKAAPYKVKATVNGVSDSVIFNAIALPGSPSSIARFGGNDQSGVNGQTLADPLVAFITDAGGNPVQGDTVEFTIQSTPFGAALSATKVPTDNLGQASTILTLGTKAGPYVVQAQSKSIGGTLVFNATALAGAPSVANSVFGNNQTMAINKALVDSFVVHVNDANGNSVPNAPVHFVIGTIPTGSVGTTLSVVDTTTDSLGNASTRLTLGNKVGVYNVDAQVNSVPVVSFTATATAGAAASLAALSGDNQSTQIITPLANEIIVHVRDAGGNSVAGVTVNFSIDSIPANATGQILASTAVVSDVNGIARTILTVGNKVGIYRVNASGTGVPNVQFTATATHGAAVSYAAVTGSNQTTPIITQLANELTVHVVDIGGNDVPSSVVTFAFDSIPANATGHQLSDTSALSDANGFARTALTVGNKVGLYRVKASSSGIPDTSFIATATHGAASALAQVSGNAQSRPTATTLDTAFVVTVTDIGGNAVPKANVSFAITSHPANATRQQLRDTLVTTDSLGIASTVLTLGDVEGAYVVSVVVPGTTPSQFISNAFYIYGDPNGDIDVNIADITMLVDHIYNRNTFSIGDSVKSDLNKDGRVDTADVGVLRDNILSRPLTFTNKFLPSDTVRISGSKTDGTKPSVPMKQQYYSEATTRLEVTPQGLRLNMVNSVPVRGIELRIRTKDTTVIDGINYLFTRAQNMDVIVRTVNNDITILVYSLLNSEIQAGEGTILRLPKITSLAQIDTSQVILAITANMAVKPEVQIQAASPIAYPVSYKLEQNYPNPFNGSTIIRYDIPDNKSSETKIAIQVFNILGQKVKTLISAPHDPGPHQIVWDGTNDSGERVATGVYFYRMITKTFLTTKKMIYVK